MFVTDGLLERNASGVDIADLLAQGANLHPREAVQYLIVAFLELTGGRLKDDAAAMCLGGRGGPPGLRDSSSGAAR